MAGRRQLGRQSGRLCLTCPGRRLSLTARWLACAITIGSAINIDSLTFNNNATGFSIGSGFEHVRRDFPDVHRREQHRFGDWRSFKRLLFSDGVLTLSGANTYGGATTGTGGVLEGVIGGTVAAPTNPFGTSAITIDGGLVRYNRTAWMRDWCKSASLQRQTQPPSPLIMTPQARQPLWPRSPERRRRRGVWALAIAGRVCLT